MSNNKMQMKKEDEQAGRLDYVYKTNLTIDECINRIGSAVPVKLSEYKTEIDNGILYISFMDAYDNAGGLFATSPQKYAVRFESMADKTIIRVRYVWADTSTNIQYILRSDVDEFFVYLFEASVLEFDNKIWTDTAEELLEHKDPLLKGFKYLLYEKRLMAVFIFILWGIMIFNIYSDSKDTKENYKWVHVNEGKALVQAEYYDSATKQECDDENCYLESEECKMLVIDLPSDGIDGELEEKIGFSFEDISLLNTIKSESDLQALFEVEDENVIDTFKTDRISFKKYGIVFKSNDKVVSINVYQQDHGSIAQIIVSDEGFFTDEEFGKMFGNLYYPQWPKKK